MSANALNSLTDENPDLHKQVGCMNGMFQVFNRRHFLTGRRIKRLPPAQRGNHGMKPDSTIQKTTEINMDEVVKERRRFSIESSRTSFSSSCSSTFSSVDWNRAAKPEPSSLGHNNFLETPSQMSTKKQPLSSSHPSHQFNLLDVVKDSINREARGLSVKTTTKAERKNHVLKHIDSPRPIQPSNLVKAKVSALDRSFPLKDTHRYSYDGRDTLKAAIKLKETPRLSLDSRQSSIRRSASESRSNYLLDDLEQRNVKSSQTLDPTQEPGSNNRRMSGVVAKLMGLDAFPDSRADINDRIRMTECCQDEDLDAMSTTSRKADESKHNQVSRSPRTPRTPSPSSQSRNINAIVKPHSAFPLEPAPWRKTERNVGSGKPASTFSEAQVQKKAQNPHSSLYGEIEGRLTQIEFKRSGKDLRALKQILDAMQTRRECSKDAYDLKPQIRNYSTDYHKLDHNIMSRLDSSQQSIHLTNSTIAGIGPLKRFESSSSFMKQAKVRPIDGMPGLRKLRTNENANNGRTSVEKRSANNLAPRNSHFREPYRQPLCSMDKRSSATICKPTQSSRSPQNRSRDDPSSPGKSSTTVSPRLQQKQHGMEKQSCSTTKIFDSRRSRRHLGKQQIDSSSPSTICQQKSLIELSAETRQCDAISEQSESNISSASQPDTEVTCIDSSNEIHGAYQHEGPRNNKEARLTEDRSKAESSTATLEQPSPVSVLDTSFYREGSPSPVKKTSNAFKEESQDFDETEWNPEDIQDLLNNTGSKLSIDFGREQSENMKHLVHELRQLNSKQDEPATDYVSSLCKNTNPEHKYIAEILLASQLLFKDLVSVSTFVQLHSSSNLINPKLFFVLEQTKTGIEFSEDECTNEMIGQSKVIEKIHRKLVFDTVNEILCRKLSPAGYSEPWIRPNNMGVNSLTGHKLLKEVCSEVDQLQAKPNCSIHDEDDGLRIILSEDMMFQTLNWEDCHSEIQGLVLGIERLIFKDLISEVVGGEVTGHPGRPAVHCKQLFPT